jgi:hypothetical protein
MTTFGRSGVCGLSVMVAARAGAAASRIDAIEMTSCIDPRYHVRNAHDEGQNDRSLTTSDIFYPITRRSLSDRVSANTHQRHTNRRPLSFPSQKSRSSLASHSALPASAAGPLRRFGFSSQVYRLWVVGGRPRQGDWRDRRVTHRQRWYAVQAQTDRVRCGDMACPASARAHRTVLAVIDLRIIPDLVL